VLGVIPIRTALLRVRTLRAQRWRRTSCLTAASAPSIRSRTLRERASRCAARCVDEGHPANRPEERVSSTMHRSFHLRSCVSFRAVAVFFNESPRIRVPSTSRKTISNHSDP
jgi:hypothetical protein